ncbi:sodium:proton antiporter [Paenibacillus sp. FSL H8-0548]|uniref:ABC transporter permease n=1 Tax=Paenibacillus sp. FSL H8-0548 TaxID=1920422 RepID=UPI00096E6D06|nr:ABC transporter permease [Paenibacillus sp. FSL H8-0548]OMF26281.1 sodium:proton antiporter [Paenibacillus sp. FSL H8-0548]
MYKAILRKGLETFITLFCATLIIFVLTHLAPGDPVQMLLNKQIEVARSDSEAYQVKAAELREQWGLDQNIVVQYGYWINRLLHFDLGSSIHTGRLVSSEIAERLPATIMLSIAALFIQIVLGLWLGTVSALRAGKVSDNIIRFICVALASIPGFVIGLVLLSLFAVKFNAYEISSHAGLTRLWLPAVTLGLIGAPQIIRVVRANMLSEFGQIYVTAALSRGLAIKLIVKHVIRNVLLPVVTMVALSFTTLISGAVVIESIFSWPGIGKYALDSILLKDYPVIQGYAFVMVSVVVFTNLVIDAVYAAMDPRIRSKGEA